MIGAPPSDSTAQRIKQLRSFEHVSFLFSSVLTILKSGTCRSSVRKLVGPVN